MIEHEISNPQALIIREKHSKKAQIHVCETGKWSLYSGVTIKKIDFTRPILTGEGQGVHNVKTNTLFREYFCFEAKLGRAILADNHLPISGAFNYRDLGGFVNKEGKHIKWGKLFRADEMSHLTDEDLAYLASIPITSVIDFRAHSEVRRSPDRLPGSARFLYPIAITPGNLSTEGVQANLLHTDVGLYMEQMNRVLVTEAETIRAFRQMFSIIQNKLSAPIIYHCTAGKDRTGVATALILHALGIEEEVIMEDYMKSKINLEDKYSAFIQKYPKAEAMFTVKESYLQAALDQIKENHGTVDDFLIRKLKVDINRLQSMYLI